MATNIPDFQNQHTRNFQNMTDLFFGPAGLPFAEIFSAERIQRIFAKHGCLFGMHGVYNTAVMVWSFLGQVLRDGKEASCQAAVVWVVTHCQLTGQTPPTSDTGDYCRAREKVTTPALRELSCEVAEELESSAEGVGLPIAIEWVAQTKSVLRSNKIPL